MTHACPSCGAEMPGARLRGACDACGASYAATFTSKLWLYAAIFLGVLFGPMVAVPFMVSRGLDPQSLTAILVGVFWSVGVTLFLGALSLRMLKFEKG